MLSEETQMLSAHLFWSLGIVQMLYLIEVIMFLTIIRSIKDRVLLLFITNFLVILLIALESLYINYCVYISMWEEKVPKGYTLADIINILRRSEVLFVVVGINIIISLFLLFVRLKKLEKTQDK